MIQHFYLVLINKSLRAFFLYCNCLYCNFFFIVILGSSKKISVAVDPINIFLYFDTSLNPDKVKKLHSFCIAKSIRYIATLIKRHSDSYRCHCFKCLLCRLLISVLLSRGHKRLLYIVNGKNYLYISNENFFNCLRNKNGSRRKNN